MRKAVHYTALVVVTCWASILSACVQPSADLTATPAFFSVRADSIMPRVMEEHGIPGAAVVLVENGEIVWSKGYGLADAGERQPMTPETVVNVGSVSKSITAWAVMLLVERGDVELDAPISDYVMTWALPDTPFDERGVTVRRLLNHTAGTSQHGVDFVQLDEPVPPLEEALSAAENGAGVRLVAEPGSGWRYSGGGTTLLQLMIEEVTGEPYETFVQEHVFEPLGMESSGFGWPPELLSRAAQPYASDGRLAAYQQFAASGAAGLTTTALDLALFAAAAVEGERPAGRGVLRPSTLDSMWAQPATVTNPDWPNAGSGLGYFVDVLPGGTVEVGHGGSNTGWQAVFRVHPAQRAALVVVTNSSNGWVFFLPTDELTCAWYSSSGMDCPSE